MNEGVKILIERMKTNPEDFGIEPTKAGIKEGKFYWVTIQIRDYLMNGREHMHLALLKKDDKDALVDAFRDLHQQEFTDKVMNSLFKDEEEKPTIQPQYQRASWTDPRLIAQQGLRAQGLQNAQPFSITTLEPHNTTTGLGGILGGFFK